jgi:hypothetical protein
VNEEQDDIKVIQDHLYNLSCSKPSSQQTMWEHVMLQFACAIVSNSYEIHSHKNVIELAGDLTVEYFKHNCVNKGWLREQPQYKAALDAISKAEGREGAMNNNGWITDRLPTEEDGSKDPNFYGYIWCYFNGKVRSINWRHHDDGLPWQPLKVPEPYVKSKRWKVGWSQKGTTTSWTLYSYDQSVHTLLGDLSTEAAERIADIYNEVLP